MNKENLNVLYLDPAVINNVLTDAKRKLSFIKQALLAIASHAVVFRGVALLGRSVIQLPPKNNCMGAILAKARIQNSKMLKR